ncbi:MAG TPA: hypothetical protein VMB49_05185 [Acidobacteriaceae bacterium]|nr:hypothetical protein [Acidobacteriaceae bacterium]
MQFPRWQAIALLVIALSPSIPSPVWGQGTAPQPVLHRRSYNQVEEELDIGTRSTGRTILPVDASGEYRLGSTGTIEVDLQPDRLSGFITRLGDHESDEGTPLTFFFATSRLSGQRLSFTTRQVHGIWFSFDGTIVRGSAQSRSQQGYYLLEGQLTMHDAFAQTLQARMVSLPLAGQSTNG